jgi:two-component system, sensor histidine kinase and response regulator
MEKKTRILLVDDNEAIHEDITSILSSHRENTNPELQSIEEKLFGSKDESLNDLTENIDYEIDHAYQGKEALQMVDQAEADGKPFSLIFMDVRMPPGNGWN